MSGLSEEVAETRRFLEVPGELQLEFSLIQTEWRRGGFEPPVQF